MAIISSNYIRKTNWLIALLGMVLIVDCIAEICPDHKMSCRKGQTCCDNKAGGFACCPYDNATCCSDGLHCCPEDTTCDLSAGRCRRNKVLVQKELVPAAENFTGNDNLLLAGYFGDSHHDSKHECPDQKQRCPASYTCCKDPEEGYSCCPYENATCCSDRIHCCPQGSKCGDGSCE